jgi:hypothetical protein
MVGDGGGMVILDCDILLWRQASLKVTMCGTLYSSGVMETNGG